MIEIKSVSVLK